MKNSASVALLLATVFRISTAAFGGEADSGTQDAGNSDAAVSADAGAVSSDLACQDIRGTYSVPVGTACKTSRGHRFERVDGGWKDLALNRILFDLQADPEHIQPNIKVVLLDPEVRDDRWKMSRDWCVSQGRVLPSGKDFETLHEHHFLELFQDMAASGYWTSDESPDWKFGDRIIPAPLRSLFNARTGDVISDVRDVRENNAPYPKWKVFIWARCISK